MKVETVSGGSGVIVEVRKPMVQRGDPEVKIKTARGFIYLFQTALNGYKVIAT